jgi:hypothetical protein
MEMSPIIETANGLNIAKTIVLRMGMKDKLIFRFTLKEVNK